MGRWPDRCGNRSDPGRYRVELRADRTVGLPIAARALGTPADPVLGAELRHTAGTTAACGPAAIAFGRVVSARHQRRPGHPHSGPLHGLRPVAVPVQGASVHPLRGLSVARQAQGRLGAGQHRRPPRPSKLLAALAILSLLVTLHPDTSAAARHPAPAPTLGQVNVAIARAEGYLDGLFKPLAAGQAVQSEFYGLPLRVFFPHYR